MGATAVMVIDWRSRSTSSSIGLLLISFWYRFSSWITGSRRAVLKICCCIVARRWFTLSVLIGVTGCDSGC